MTDNENEQVIWYFYCVLRNTQAGPNYSSGTIGTRAVANGSGFLRDVRAAIATALGWNDEFVLISLSRL